MRTSSTARRNPSHRWVRLALGRSMRRAIVTAIIATIAVGGFPSDGHAETDDPATTAPPTSEGDGDAPITEEPGDGSNNGDDGDGDTTSGSEGDDDLQLADVPILMWVALGALLVVVIVWSTTGSDQETEPE